MRNEARKKRSLREMNCDDWGGGMGKNLGRRWDVERRVRGPAQPADVTLGERPTFFEQASPWHRGGCMKSIRRGQRRLQSSYGVDRMASYRRGLRRVLCTRQSSISLFFSFPRCESVLLTLFHAVSRGFAAAAARLPRLLLSFLACYAQKGGCAPSWSSPIIGLSDG